MRIMTSCLLLSSFILLSGCEWMKNGRKPTPAQVPAAVNNGQPTVEQLVSYLNKEADRLTSIETTDIGITTHVQKQRLPGLTGFMVCEKSRNFRLTGDVVSTQYVDIGSNNNQFWFWVKDADAPLYYCSYDNYEKGVKLPMPFQPEWVVQALGMAKYDPTRSYKVEVKRDTYELIENTTVQGMPVRKITVFTSAPVKDTYPQVIGHIVQDAATGKAICQATIKRMRSASYRTAEGTASVSYPSDILLEWPAEQISMRMEIGKATVNKRITNEEASRYFTLPSWPGLKTIDLANMPLRGNPTSRDIRQAGGIR